LLFLFLTLPAYGQGVTVQKDGTFKPQELALPYAFYNQNFGAAAGFVYGASGWPQKQATLLGTAIAGTDNALALLGIVRDVQAPFTNRLFLDADAVLSWYGTIYSYTNGNPAYRGQQAGSNNSRDNDYIRGPGNDYIGRVKFRYLLPIGNGEDEVISTYVLDQGLLVKGAQGGSSWNPFTSGKTYLEVRPYWREQEVRSYFDRLDQKTNGADFSIVRDNTDFPKNPSTGSFVRARYTQDWGYFDSTTKYNVIDVEFAKYFSLGPSENFRQRVLALDFWTANSPSWDDSTTKNNGEVVFERPPAWAGATLGGLWRMRAYPTGRFHDQAAIYYSAEYRMIPEWNPFEKNEWIQNNLGIAWWQWVPFVEAGRVAPDWDIRTLHSAMKFDGGFGVRAVAKGIVIRVDFAMGNAGNYGVQMMVAQPFEF
jgi:surface antigen Omp85-like protein